MGTGRNIWVKKETRRMRVFDDESYDNRCDESTSQSLNCVPNRLVIDSEDGEKIEHT